MISRRPRTSVRKAVTGRPTVPPKWMRMGVPPPRERAQVTVVIRRSVIDQGGRRLRRTHEYLLWFTKRAKGF